MKLPLSPALKPAALRLGVAALTLLSLSVDAQAQSTFRKPEDAVKYRQSALQVMGHHSARLGAMTSGRAVFDAKAAQESGEVIELVSRLPWEGFRPETQSISPKVKSAFWTEQARAKELSEKMMAEARHLAAATRSGNLDQIKAAYGPLAQSCKACHDSYRE